MADNVTAALEHARKNREDILAQLTELVGIPSVSKGARDDGSVRAAAEWLAERLRALPVDGVQVMPTEGHPVVYGELLTAGPTAPTVALYGHYDVQSAAPLDDWKSEPFEAVVRGDYLYGRGVSDNKGQIMAVVAAVEALIASGGPPVNLKFLLEGEEEMGSLHIGSFLDAHRDLLSCDFVLNPDTGMLGIDRPTIFYGLRGMYFAKLRISGPVRDLHSGSFGGIVHNPIHALCALVAGMHDRDGRVTLPGFYEKVRPITPEEHAEMAALPRGEDVYLEESGAPELWGDSDFIPAEREAARPALDVIHITAGSSKAAIPAEAHAIVSTRLVPDQVPEEVHDQLIRYLESHSPSTVTWEILEWSGCSPSVTDRNAPQVKALAAAMETVWGRKPVFYRSGGSIAAVGQIQEVLGVDSLLTGFSLPGDHIHGPNERLHLPTWEHGIEALIHFFHNLAQMATG
jgi:acetylornithine deacetylase/succinyl-diaminopimelate desuccinylase-like protein